MAASDLLVLSGLLVGTVLFFLRHRSVPARGRTLFASTWLSFFGLILVLAMLAHTIEIVTHLVRGDTQISGERWTYDFRTYALLLLGAVLITIGVGVLKASVDVSRGRAGGHARAAGLAAAALAVVLPLIPVQAFFGVLFSALGGVTLLVLAATRGAVRTS